MLRQRCEESVIFANIGVDTRFVKTLVVLARCLPVCSRDFDTVAETRVRTGKGISCVPSRCLAFFCVFSLEFVGVLVYLGVSSIFLCSCGKFVASFEVTETVASQQGGSSGAPEAPRKVQYWYPGSPRHLGHTRLALGIGLRELKFHSCGARGLSRCLDTPGMRFQTHVALGIRNTVLGIRGLQTLGHLGHLGHWAPGTHGGPRHQHHARKKCF